MKKICLQEHDLVFVCDSRMALLLENEGNQMFPHLSVVEIIEPSLFPDRGYHGHAAGRVRPTATPRQSRVEKANGRDMAERDFLQRLARHLENTLAATKRRNLVIVAPAGALKMLRSRYTPLIRQTLRCEVESDLVSAPINKIEEMLAAQLG